MQATHEEPPERTAVSPRRMLPFPLGQIFPLDETLPCNGQKALLGDVLLPLLQQAEAQARLGQHALKSPAIEGDYDVLPTAFEIIAEQLHCAQKLVRLCLPAPSPATPAEKGGESSM